RYFHVTGVQTCALPIWTWSRAPLSVERVPRHERCVITRIPMTFLSGFTLFHSIGPIRVIFHVPHRKVIPNRTREPPILNDGVYFERSDDEFLVCRVRTVGMLDLRVREHLTVDPGSEPSGLHA